MKYEGVMKTNERKNHDNESQWNDSNERKWIIMKIMKIMKANENDNNNNERQWWRKW